MLALSLVSLATLAHIAVGQYVPSNIGAACVSQCQSISEKIAPCVQSATATGQGSVDQLNCIENAICDAGTLSAYQSCLNCVVSNYGAQSGLTADDAKEAYEALQQMCANKGDVGVMTDSDTTATGSITMTSAMASSKSMASSSGTAAITSKVSSSIAAAASGASSSGASAASAPSASTSRSAAFVKADVKSAAVMGLAMLLGVGFAA